MSRLEAITTTDPAQLAAEIVAAALIEAVSERGRFLMVLAGGRTPEPLYRRLSDRSDLPWDRVHLFWGDERFVPSDHAASNARSVREALVDRVPVPAEHVHPWPIMETANASAAAYAATIIGTAGDPPKFDLSLLGLGADCHTASLFPGTGAHASPGITLASRPAAAVGERLSLTAGALSRSLITVFLVTGPEKRGALAGLLDESGDPDTCPARAIGARERLMLLTDQPLPV
ncbi:MAG: 6-phosphogluconolactonase [Trueperaceae bacterium]